jgi:hypothetical protein
MQGDAHACRRLVGIRQKAFQVPIGGFFIDFPRIQDQQPIRSLQIDYNDVSGSGPVGTLVLGTRAINAVSGFAMWRVVTIDPSTWDVKRSSRFKRKPRNYRSSEAQTRYYVSTKRFSCRRTLNLRSSCIDRKNTAFGHLEGFRPSDSLYFPSRSMPFGQISYVFRARMTHACRHLRNF